MAGLSLVEVLVVLVIIVVGILTVVQLFPAGFGVMHASMNASAADRLAQDALESMKQNGSPDGIYASVIDSSLSTPAPVCDPSIPPDDLSTASTIAGLPAPTSPAATDVDKIRYIHNETFTVTATHTVTNAATPTPIHVLNFGPIYVSNPTSPQADVVVNSTNWTAITGNSEPDTSKTYDTTLNAFPPVDDPSETLVPGDSQYMIDYNVNDTNNTVSGYTGGWLAVAPEPYDQVFIFTVTAGPTIQTATVQQVRIVVPGTSDASPYNGTTWFSLDGGSNTYISPTPQYPATSISGTWVAGTASMYRPFQYKASTAFDNDPYEFNLNETSTTGTPINPTVGNFNVGVLAFNPALAYQQGTQAITVQASYYVYDWHVLHEDHELAVDASATGGSNTVRLAIGDIKQVGDIQTDGTPASGVILGQGQAPANQYDFIFLNIDTGAMAVADNHGLIYDDDANNGYTGAGAIHVSFRNGRLTLPMPLTDSTGATIQHLRIYYRGSADWAVAVQRAPSQFVSVTSLPGFNAGAAAAPYFNSPTALVPGAAGSVVTTPVPIPPTANVYYYNDTGTGANVGALHTIYFPLCDQGKAIALSNVTVQVAYNGNTGTASIPSVELGNDLLALVVTKTEEHYDLTQIKEINAAITTAYDMAGGTGAAPAGTPSSISFSGVNGESARAVVIWRDQSVWKQHTLDTILHS